MCDIDNVYDVVSATAANDDGDITKILEGSIKPRPETPMHPLAATPQAQVGWLVAMLGSVDAGVAAGAGAGPAGVAWVVGAGAAAAV